jgi:hypothetical protein
MQEDKTSDIGVVSCRSKNGRIKEKLMEKYVSRMVPERTVRIAVPFLEREFVKRVAISRKHNVITGGLRFRTTEK